MNAELYFSSGCTPYNDIYMKLLFVAHIWTIFINYFSCFILF